MYILTNIKGTAIKYLPLAFLLFMLFIINTLIFTITINNNSITKRSSPSLNVQNTKVDKFKVENVVQATTHNAITDINVPEYWINKLPDKDNIILSYDKIKSFNNKIYESVPTMCDIENFKETTISSNNLLSHINAYSFPNSSKYDDNGQNISQKVYDNIRKNINLTAIKSSNVIKYGISIRKTNLRSFPSDQTANTSPNSGFDVFQQTALDTCKPVIILHKSSDNNWFFVEMYNYTGWVKSADIAIANDKQEIINFLNTDNFLMVTDNHISSLHSTDKDLSLLTFNLGDKLILSSKNDSKDIFYIDIPIRDSNGNLKFKTTQISKSSDVSIGYLPYTRSNIIREAFKLLGDPYDWGNKYTGRDCSSFVNSIYSTFGFEFPRNTDEQQLIPGIKIKFNSSQGLTQRKAMMNGLKPGSAIYMNNHAMLYLGKINGAHYIIHDFSSYSEYEGNVLHKVNVNKVAVTSTEILNNSGSNPFINLFTSIVTFE